MELYELHVGNCSLGTIHHGDAIAGGDDWVGGGDIDSTATTGTHHGHLGQIGIYLLGLRVQNVGTIALDVGGAACHTHAQMVLGDNLYSEVVLFDVDIGIVAYRLHQTALDLCTGIVLVVQNTELGVTALTVQVELPLLGLVEVHTPVNQLFNLGRGHPDHLFYSFGVADIVARNHGVFYVFLEVIQFEIGD